MPKNKPNKGLLKRIRITKSGRIKYRRAFGRHLRSHKSGQLMRSYRKPAFLSPNESARVRALIPGLGLPKTREDAPEAATTES